MTFQNQTLSNALEIAREKKLKDTKPANVLGAENVLKGLKEMDEGEDQPSLDSLSEDSKAFYLLLDLSAVPEFYKQSKILGTCL